MTIAEHNFECPECLQWGSQGKDEVEVIGELWPGYPKYKHAECPEVYWVDQRGHSFTRPTARKSSVDLRSRFLHSDGTVTDLSVHGLNSSLDFMHECTWCGVRPTVYFNDDRTGLVADSDCSQPDGILTEYEVTFPTGRVIMKDDLRGYGVPDFTDEDLKHSYNTAIGQHEAVMWYAARDIAYGPVGNSCPTVYQLADGSLRIMNAPQDEDSDEPKPVDGKELGWICTDLWAYTIVDVSKLDESNLPDGMGVSIVDIKPGVWRFKHYTTLRSFDRDAYEDGIVYADAKWVREAP